MILLQELTNQDMLAVTDTSERELERLICKVLTGNPCDPPSSGTVGEPPSNYGGVGWSPGNHHDYKREYCIDLVQLSAFLHVTQPDSAATFRLDEDCPIRHKFLVRLQNEITKRGTLDVLRNGIKHRSHNLDLFYGLPSAHNKKAQQRFGQNRFTVTRQLFYSLDDTRRSLDIGLFINGLPVFTLELKNNLTKQNVVDAVYQYKRDRNPREPLFAFGRCVAHFAVDENEVRYCTQLNGKASWFLPFNRGREDGAGNPPNENGLRTEYLWCDLLSRESVSDILENYAQVVTSKDIKTGKSKKVQIWPRYHQIDVVRRLLKDACVYGVGKKYLIQHSAGSGKSHSIAWLAHRLIPLIKDGKTIFDSIIVVTDRIILDKQICDTIRQYAHVGATVGHAKQSGDLRKFIIQGKKIIISTIQKFPFILDEIGNEQRERTFAIIIDEAHSSQGGKASAAVSTALGTAGELVEEETYEDRINRLMESHKLLPNASYYAFTATPKNKTLEIFGNPDPRPDRTVRHLPFHNYSMKQAIQEGFILDVLEYYTPVRSYYRLIKTVENDPKFDVRKAHKKLRRYVESHKYAIRLKAEIMVDHFHEQVIAPRKINGKARAMVVTNGVERAIKYFYAIQDYLEKRKSPYRAIIAFSGERNYGGIQVTETTINGFPSAHIAEMFQEDPYRFLICADKFQTGYDEPLLHTMYVDKTLSGIKAVQTLSRLNRAHPKKYDVFVLDFLNNTETIAKAFSSYYRTTILADETDPNKLHDLQSDLDGARVYSAKQVRKFVQLYLKNVERDKLDSILDQCVEVYRSELAEDEQIEFKRKAKTFVRTYAFLSSILPYNDQSWEELSIFLNFLILKLPSPIEEDLSRGLLETIDMDSYRIEKHSVRKIILEDKDAEIEPIPESRAGGRGEVEIDHLSVIIKQFNDHFGGIEWNDEDRVIHMITKTIPAKVSEDAKFKNARKNSGLENARIEHNKALERTMIGVVNDDTELFRQFMDNADFKQWMEEVVFKLTYGGSVASETPQ